MRKATQAKAIALGTLMALSSKFVKAQEGRTVMSKQKMVTASVPGDNPNKRKIVQFSDAKKWLDIKPQLFVTVDAPHGAKCVGATVFELKPSIDFFNNRVSVGANTTCELGNYGTKSISPSVRDFYGHADVKVGNGKSIEVKYGNFNALDYCNEVSDRMPLSVEYVNRLELNSGFYLPVGAMVSFHDKNYSAGVGLSSSTPHKWQGEKNVFISGEYYIFGDFKVGGVLSYNIDPFDDESKTSKNFKDRISGAAKLLIDALDDGAVLFEVGGFGAQDELTIHLFGCFYSSFVPNLAYSADFFTKLKFNNQPDPLDPFDGSFVPENLKWTGTLWYKSVYVSVGADVGFKFLYELQNQTGNIRTINCFYIETGTRLSLAKLAQMFSR